LSKYLRIKSDFSEFKLFIVSFNTELHNPHELGDGVQNVVFISGIRALCIPKEWTVKYALHWTS